MALYRHKNMGMGIIAIFDTKNNCHTLRQGEECIIDRDATGNGIVMIEEIQEEKKRDASETEQIIKKRKTER